MQALRPKRVVHLALGGYHSSALTGAPPLFCDEAARATRRMMAHAIKILMIIIATDPASSRSS